MNVILVIASFIVIVVALEVLSAMQLGVTCWMQFPTWIGIAMAAFLTMLTERSPSPGVVALVVSLAGLLWRHRKWLAHEVSTASRVIG